MKALINELKEKGQDYELYPTTREMLNMVYQHMFSTRLHGTQNILDIGCGTCNFMRYLSEYIAAYHEKGCFHYNYYVMEKSPILINQLPSEAIVVGTDFNECMLIDKVADIVFCNPPYSEFVNWTKRILFETAARHIYLVIPERWKHNDEIRSILEVVNGKAEVLGSFDFLNAERTARAKVDVLYVSKHPSSDLAFDTWFDETFPIKDDWQEENHNAALKQQLIAGKDKVQILVNAYNHEHGILAEHFRSITSLSADILKSIGITKDAVKESLKSRMKGLKSKYWRLVFDNLEAITSRLTSNTREKMFSRFSGLTTAEFTASNIYSLVVWVVKNANIYFDEQLVDFYRGISTRENVIPYKSNQRVFKDSGWRYQNTEFSHYTLDYRIVCNSWYMSRHSAYYVYSSDRYKGAIDDICTVAANLGFHTYVRSDVRETGEKGTVYLSSMKPLLEYRFYKNGNVHLKLNQEFAKAINVEAARILGWIKSYSDIKKEFPENMSDGAEQYFCRNHTCSLSRLPLIAQ